MITNGNKEYQIFGEEPDKTYVKYGLVLGTSVEGIPGLKRYLMDNGIVIIYQKVSVQRLIITEKAEAST